MRRSEEGSMLLAVIAGIVIFGALGAGIASMISSGVRSSVDHSLSTQALYLAESGIEWAGKELRQGYEDTENWTDECSELESKGPRHIGDSEYFEVLASEAESDDCKIRVLGWVGAENKEDAFVSRRLESNIPKWFIEDAFPPGKNMFNDGEEDWQQRKGVEFEDGKLLFQRKGKGSGKGSRTKTRSPADVIQEFDSGDDVFFGAYIQGLESIDAHEFILKASPNFLVNDYSVEFKDKVEDDGKMYLFNPHRSQMPDSADLMQTNYNLIFYFHGADENIDDTDFGGLELYIDWDKGEPDEITVERACLGTAESCTASMQDPTEDQDLNEE